MIGKLSEVKPGIVIQLHGNPIITGNCYRLEKLRCALCNRQYAATLPEALAKQPKYAPSCLSVLALHHYQLGLPFKRIESWQRSQGIPIADATQWDKMSQLYSVVKPVYHALETQAAQGSLLHYDDTHHKILSHLQDHRQGLVTRKGIYSTAIISQVADKSIYLFCTGARYAGENIAAILAQRNTDEALITMSDASTMNLPKSVQATLLARWVICFCLVHGRRKFHELTDIFAQESHFVLDIISKVYQHEATCRAEGFSLAQRLAYHQQHSRPLMDSLYIWLTNQLVYEKTEPNSGLGQAIRYLLKYWSQLTRFLHHGGAPIDNNLSERTLKVAIRYRKNSLFFKTPKGAAVGDCLMSIIHTAAQHGVNVFDYLNQLQCNAQAVAKSPEQWLPWRYQQQLGNDVSKAA